MQAREMAAVQTAGDMRHSQAQTADHVLMIRPAGFTSNPETVASNAFQRGAMAPAAAQASARKEFDAYVEALRDAGVGALVVDDTLKPHTPDSIFPNNWVSFGADGRVFLYPMEACNRRLERRAAVLAEVGRHFSIRGIVDLTPLEQQGKFLEGTGSMVLDHDNKLAYACHSSRSHPEAMAAFEKASGYRAVWFHAAGRDGRPVYHTNVMMCVGQTLAIVCLETVTDPGERASLREHLQFAGKRIIDIGIAQMERFSGNMIELRSQRGDPVFAMSRSAWNALSGAQQGVISDYARPVIASLNTIEQLGGGSARCMVAEIFLPKRERQEGARRDPELDIGRLLAGLPSVQA